MEHHKSLIHYDSHPQYLILFFRIPLNSKLNKEDEKIMRQFTDYVAEFVKYGQPTHGNPDKTYPIHWNKFAPGKGIYMLIENPPKTSQSMPFQSTERPDRIKFWNQEIFGHSEDIESDYLLTKKDEL